jgi:UDP-glucose 4-epimerase
MGAAGFIGTNLTITLAEEKDKMGNLVNQLTLFDLETSNFSNITEKGYTNVSIVFGFFNMEYDFASIVKNQDVIYHLISSTIPSTSNSKIPQELMMNVVVTSILLEECVKAGVKKVIFLSSGGTVYGKATEMPLKETSPTYPISSYGVQKITIEKLLYLYYYMYDLDYRVIRLSNPYGPYQRPNGLLGAVTTFTYKALLSEPIYLYGDGSVIRDFIYIDDAIRGIINIVKGNSDYKTFNLGSGNGHSIQGVIESIEKSLKTKIKVEFKPGRKADVPENVLNICRYEEVFGKLNPINLESGVKKTAEFLIKMYSIPQ